MSILSKRMHARTASGLVIYMSDVYIWSIFRLKGSDMIKLRIHYISCGQIIHL